MSINKSVCFLSRTKTTSTADEPEMERQRSACLQFAERQGWIPVREFWGKEDCASAVENSADSLMELRTGAEKKAFDIILVSEFSRLGRLPAEGSFAASFFEHCGVKVWSADHGHIGALVLK